MQLESLQVTSNEGHNIWFCGEIRKISGFFLFCFFFQLKKVPYTGAMKMVCS